MNMDILEILASILVLTAIYLAFNISKYLKIKNNNQRINNNLTIISSIDIDKIDNTIDKVINDTFNSYMITNVLHKGVKYIHDEMQKEIIYNVSELVTNRLSTDIIIYMSLMYSSDHISDIIASKVYILANEYFLHHNMPK